jgi:hypothetical protein
MKEMRDRVQAQFMRNARLLGAYKPSPDPKNTPCWMLLCKDTIDTMSLYNVYYPWLCDEEFRIAGTTDWENLIGQAVPVVDLKGDHFNLFHNRHVSLRQWFRQHVGWLLIYS